MDRYEVAWAPIQQLDEALQVFHDFILGGINIDKELNYPQIVQELFSGSTRLGLAYEINPFKPLGSWFSDIRIDQSQEFDYVTIYGLSGENPNAWAPGLVRLLTEYARARNCPVVRWYGKLGWLKFDNGIKLLEKVSDRIGLFEKAVM